MEFRDYIRLLRRTQALIVGLAVLGAVVGGAFAALAKPVYQSTATSFVTTPGGRSLPDLSAGVSYVQAALRSYAALATTASVLDPVIEEEGLDTTRAALADRIQVEAREQQSMLLVTVSDDRPRRAARIANAVSAEVSRVGTPAGGALGLTQVDPAVADDASVSTQPVIAVILGAAAGIVLAVLIGLLRELTDTRVRGRQDLKRITGAPLLGTTVQNARASRHPLVLRDAAGSPEAEDYRTIRTNLGFTLGDSKDRSILVVSSDEHEGKSTVAANVALAEARLGKRVILVDADLRHPALAGMFGIGSSVGLSDVIIGRSELEDAVQSIGEESLDLLTAGGLPPNPNELLQSTGMHDLLERLHDEYDLIVVDTPPLLAVSDAAVLSPHVGGALLVCAESRSRRDRVGQGLDVLDRAGARLLGVVFTMVSGEPGDGQPHGTRAKASAEQRPPLPVRIDRLSLEPKA